MEISQLWLKLEPTSRTSIIWKKIKIGLQEITIICLGSRSTFQKLKKLKKTKNIKVESLLISRKVIELIQMLVNSFVAASSVIIQCEKDLGRSQSFEIIKEIQTGVKFGSSGDYHSARPYRLFLKLDYENTTLASGLGFHELERSDNICI